MYVSMKNKRVWWGRVKERDHLEGPDLEGRIILICIFKKWDGGMDWVDLAQNRDK